MRTDGVLGGRVVRNQPSAHVKHGVRVACAEHVGRASLGVLGVLGMSGVLNMLGMLGVSSMAS